MPVQTRLGILIHQRHWQSHQTFSAEYDRAARAIDPKLKDMAPRRAQLHRWMSGGLQRLPYGDHCRVLEQMFPGWTAQQLFDLDAGEHSAFENPPAFATSGPGNTGHHLGRGPRRRVGARCRRRTRAPRRRRVSIAGTGVLAATDPPSSCSRPYSVT
ncbi:MAG: hypothetical protein ACRDPW_02345 [Mycobacteriales bacterium]